MNRQQALEKSFLEFKEWPYKDHEAMIVSTESNSYWGSGRFDSIGAVNPEIRVMMKSSWMEVSTKQDWLDAKASKDKNMIDWNNAPEGATHYFKGGACHHSHWCNSKGELFVEKYPEDGWQKDTGFKYPLKDLEYVKRPTEQPYIPQVGEWCKVFGGVYGSDEMQWSQKEVMAIKEGRVLAESTTHSGVYRFYSNGEFRPIKTERDKFIEMATVDYLEMVGSDAVNSKWFARIFGAMFDAGYNKND